MDTLLKFHATGETVVISYDEFKDRIRKGEISPQDQVQDRVLTDGQWWTVDNLKIFHRLSPLRCAKGRHLLAREVAEEEAHRFKKGVEMQAAEQAALAREFFQNEQSGRDRILSALYRFLFACHEAPLMGQEFAVRFTYLPSFCTPLFVRASRRGAEWELHYKAGTGPGNSHAIRACNEIQRILELVEAADLAELAPNDNVSGFDGSTWAVEVAQRSNYAFRYRWSPTHDTDKRRLTTFVELGKYLAGLSNLLSSPDEIY